ncbi:MULTISPECIES: MFS transporter [unclassified Francisella]|uniref:MFS transporter n=1 Tax=unclassified Francisella TaxID=2610885 RepID=UPI002E2F6B28|nr:MULTISPECIES: MFS transporter [unclassified Francisella]MED7819452.1 MFS transporter [Francisella sp. 19S2-4]MED7830241.1 MFS transporter [Francisella sp. 19S2-10]
MKKSLIPLMLGALTIGITEFIMMGILPQISQYFQVSIPQAGHLISIYALGVIIGAPALVLFSKKLSPRSLLIALSIMIALFNSLSIFSTSYDFLMVTRFLSGLPHGAFFGVGAIVAMEVADRGKQSLAIALMFTGLTIANIIGVPLATHLVLITSWQAAFVIVGLIGIATTITTILWIPHVDLNKEESNNNTSTLKVMMRLDTWLAFGVVSLAFAGLFAWYSYISPMMINITHISENSIPYVLFFVGLGMFSGNIYGGRLTDNVGALNATIASLIGLLIVLLLAYLLIDYKFISVVLSFGIGFFAFGLAPSIQTLLIKVFKGAEMFGSAVSQAGFNIANALGAFLGGLPIAYGFAYSSSIISGIILSLIGAGLLFILKYRTLKLAKS